jgi:hypothetical protein
MSALLSLGIVLHLMGISVANVLAPVITPPARHRRQEDFEDDPAFFGYYHTTNINGTREGTPTPAFCGNGATFTTSSSVDRNFITCCPDGADCGDYFVTECSLTTIAYFSDTSMEWYGYLLRKPLHKTLSH